MNCDVQNCFKRLQSGHGHVFVHDCATLTNGFQVSTFCTSLDKIRHVASGCSWPTAFEAIEFMRLAFDLQFDVALTKCFDDCSKEKRWLLIVDAVKPVILMPTANRSLGYTKFSRRFIDSIIAMRLDAVPFGTVLGHV